MKWFNEHLNWTFGLIVIISLGILVSLAITKSTPLTILGAAVFAILNIAGGLWVLRKKGQNPWYVILAVVFYLGFILLIPVLKNNLANRDDSSKISDADYYKERGTGIK